MGERKRASERVWGEGKSERDLEDMLEQFFQGNSHRDHRPNCPLHISELLLCILLSVILTIVCSILVLLKTI